MTTIHERVKLLMEHYKLNVYKFAKEVGEDRAEKFYNIVKGKMKPNVETLQDIGRRYPEVNFDWLIMNRGKMLLGEVPYSNEVGAAVEIEETKPMTQHFVTRTQLLEQQLADREKMIEMLQSEVMFLRGLLGQNRK
jgi:hypothetical protein